MKTVTQERYEEINSKQKIIYNFSKKSFSQKNYPKDRINGVTQESIKE